MIQVSIKNVAKVVRGEALFTATKLDAHQGEIVGVIGKNGAGKSTLLNMLLQQDRDYSGQITVEGTMSFVPQINRHESLSGGQRTIKKIKQALSLRPDILIMDEPTSNLDEANQDWLIAQMEQFNGLVVMVSHDRHLLTSLATKIWSVEEGQFVEFDGTYQNFTKLMQEQYDNQLTNYQRQTKKQHELNKAVQQRKEKAARIRRGSRKMGQVELAKTKTAREQNAGKMERGAKALAQRAKHQTRAEKPFLAKKVKLMQSDFPSFRGKTVVRAEHLDVMVGNKKLLENVTFIIKPGDKVALKGSNGSGKTTLINHILSAHLIQLSEHAQIGYFSQDITNLPNHKTVWQFLREDSLLDADRMRQLMGAFGITHSFYQQPIQELSGGERVKLQLLHVLLGSNNFIILDEPTNFLDMTALDALADFLDQYPGTVLFVSHDANFTDEVATRILKIENKQLLDPSKTVKKHSSNELELLKLKYDRLILSPDADTNELMKLKKEINALQ